MPRSQSYDKLYIMITYGMRYLIPLQLCDITLTKYKCAKKDRVLLQSLHAILLQLQKIKLKPWVREELLSLNHQYNRR